MAFNCISLQLSSFVNIYVIICHYSFIYGMLWASLDRLLGRNLCIKCFIQVPTKHLQWEGLANNYNLEESIYSVLQHTPGPPTCKNLHVPSPEVTGAIGAASICPAEGSPAKWASFPHIQSYSHCMGEHWGTSMNLKGESAQYISIYLNHSQYISIWFKRN